MCVCACLRTAMALAKAALRGAVATVLSWSEGCQPSAVVLLHGRSGPCTRHGDAVARPRALAPYVARLAHCQRYFFREVMSITKR